MSSATVYSPGTCGELVQGLLNGHHFLVSCPIDLFAAVSVTLVTDGRVLAPPAFPKAAAALRVALRFWGADSLGARLSISSPLPHGKGMGSSTADVAGAIYALGKALKCPVDPLDVARLALLIEPTNSSFFADLALFDHRQGTVYEDLGPPPPAEVLVLDCGGQVDTLAYNAVDRRDILRELEPVAAQALRLVREGINKSDLGLLGQGATISALAHQRILPKRMLPEVIALGRELGGVGVSVGHSGTVIGILFPPEASIHAEVAGHIRARVPDLSVLGWHRLIGGGCYAQPAPARLFK